MSREKRDFNVKTPGVPSGELSEEEQAAAVEAAVDDTSDVELPAPDAMPADLKAYIDAQIAKGVAFQVGQIRKSQLDPKAPQVVLPDQSEVDATKIDKPVLSKQGYVVPHSMGRAPAHIATAIALGSGLGINKQH